MKMWENDDRTGILLTLNDKPGSLNEALNVFKQYGINMTSIASRPPKHFNNKKEMSFFIDFVGTLNQDHVKMALNQLKTLAVPNGVVTMGTKEVPWFPTKIEDFNMIGKRVLSEGDGIQDADHPGFRDVVYRKRREEINNAAAGFMMHQPIPRLKYTKDEIETWKYCYSNLIGLFKTHACKEFNWTID